MRSAIYTFVQQAVNVTRISNVQSHSVRQVGNNLSSHDPYLYANLKWIK